MSGKKDKKRKIIIDRGNDGHIDPKTDVVPRYLTYAVTDNVTNKNGCVINKSDSDALLAKRETDANKK